MTDKPKTESLTKLTPIEHDLSTRVFEFKTENTPPEDDHELGDWMMRTLHHCVEETTISRFRAADITLIVGVDHKRYTWVEKPFSIVVHNVYVARTHIPIDMDKEPPAADE